MLDAGDYIPADGRLLECASLKVDESALTGESLGVEKTTDVIKEDEVPLGDRLNMVYSGSFCDIWTWFFCCNRNRYGH